MVKNRRKVNQSCLFYCNTVSVKNYVLYCFEDESKRLLLILPCGLKLGSIFLMLFVFVNFEVFENKIQFLDKILKIQFMDFIKFNKMKVFVI